MMKKIFIAAVTASVMVAAAVYAESGHNHNSHKEHSHSETKGSAHKDAAPAPLSGSAQATCPVMGGKIDRNHFAEHNGQRVYFCCPMCKDKFNKDPEKYISKLEQAGVTLEKTQTLCPVTGDKIDKKHYIDYQGQRVYFCRPDCKSKFSKDPQKYMKKIADSKVVLQSVQKNCPVTGKPVNRNNFADYKGRRIYFCSPDCVKSFHKEPEKYPDKLSSQQAAPAKKDTPHNHQH